MALPRHYEQGHWLPSQAVAVRRTHGREANGNFWDDLPGDEVHRDREPIALHLASSLQLLKHFIGPGAGAVDNQLCPDVECTAREAILRHDPRDSAPLAQEASRLDVV